MRRRRIPFHDLRARRAASSPAPSWRLRRVLACTKSGARRARRRSGSATKDSHAEHYPNSSQAACSAAVRIVARMMARTKVLTVHQYRPKTRRVIGSLRTVRMS